jgi:hypothetical protein
MRMRTTLAAAAGVLALAGPAFATPPAPDCHGLLLTDPAGDQYIGTSANTLVRPTKAIDINAVFLTGTTGDEKVNLRVDSLPAASQNTNYTFHWGDPDNFGYSYELTASFLTSSGTAGEGTYTLWHLDPSGSWTSLENASGRAFAEEDGVIQWDRPASITWPATFTSVSARAEQYESNALTDVALRTDTASGPDWTSPC